MSSSDEERNGRPLLWVSTTYFGQGFPYSMVHTVTETMFTALGASLETIGLTSLLHLPWNLKFLWAPWVDRFETKRRWLIAVELALGITMLGVAALANASGLALAAIVLTVMAVVAATHDIAIDGFYLEALDDDGQSRYVGMRSAAYRVSTTVAAGGVVYIGGWLGWEAAWATAAVVVFGLMVLHLALLPIVEQRCLPTRNLVLSLLRPRVLAALVGIVGVGLLEWQTGRIAQTVGPWLQRTGLSVASVIALGLLAVLLLVLALLPWARVWLARSDAPYAEAFVKFLEQPQVGRILAFVLLFRVGESFLLKMRFPFLNLEVGMDEKFFGTVIMGVGGVASIAATLLGGWLIARDGLRRWMWRFVLAQNTLNLLYMAVALVPDPAQVGLPAVTVLIFIEHMGAGLGTAVFMVYLMRCVDPRYRATHMSILTALMSIGFMLAGVTSGLLAERLGFAVYFGFTFVATVPGMILLFFVPHIDGRES